ncbi:Carbohydrate binding domain-containing protein [Algoriphagus faecimaris]|uniref:Carbohydrate binding domain-containing protein n=1 Tax=Algoriphagus faecimaris TaxID=686796 RepID=A0A1G6PLN4_9BACT|nr:carbohydrate binding domain-containing protein [Algoriphagus faecimaris]SDC80948.1 Carbohydrate binding domain-containing protein [Algoriphagus faecimaris]
MVSCTEEDLIIPPPKAGFTFSIDEETGGIVTFNNTSEEAETFQWDFGDGTFSTLSNPRKVYMEDGTYEVSLTATNAGGSSIETQTITIELIVIITDEDPPVITLTGEPVIELEIGDEFTDPGAVANDEVDGDISENIEVTGEVNPLQPGEYVLTYNVSDAAGNAAEEVTRTVTVNYDDGLLVNGDFEQGEEGWIGNGLEVREEGGNQFSFSNVTTAGNPFDVNVSQVLPIRSGSTYRLSFNAVTDVEDGRTILAGIGLNEDPFTNVTEEFSLTTDEQRFSAEFTANFDSDNSRVIFDMGAELGVVVLDNVSLELLSQNITSLPLTFEDGEVQTTVFNGAAFEVVEDPENSGNTVGKLTNSGVEFEGMFFSLSTPVNFSSDKLISMRFNTSTAGVPVLMKFEGGTADPVEVSVVAETTGWQNLIFDFDAATASYSQLTLFVDGPGATAGDFYIDDITQTNGQGSGGGGEAGCEGEPVAAVSFPVTFETCESFINTFFGEGSLTTELAPNPSQSGNNTSANALKVVKAAGTNRWAGFQNPFPENFDTNKALRLKVYSSKPNTVFRFELNSSPQPEGSGNPGPQFRTVEEANTWVELEVLFTGIPPSNTGLNQIVIKPDNPDGSDGTFTETTETYYFDDITFVDVQNGGGDNGGGDNGGENETDSGTNIAINGDFETGDDTGWILFQNGGLAELDNTENNGGSWSGKLATGGPSNPAFKQEGIGAGQVSAGDEIRVRFDHKGVIVPPGGVFNVLLFGEGANGASFTHVFNPAPVPGEDWTTFTGSFTIPADADVSNGLSLLIEAVCGGDAGCSVEANIDNVRVFINP